MQKMTVKSTWEAFLSSVSPHDLDTYTCVFRRFETLSGVPLYRANVPHVRTYRAKTTYLADSTAVTYYSRLKLMYEYFADAGIAPRPNPFCSRLAGRLPRPIPRRPQPALTPAQLRRVLALNKTDPHYQRDRLILHLLFRVGLRSAEVRKLAVSDVSSSPRGVVLLLRQTKCGQDQRQLLPLDVGRMVTKWVQKVPQDGPLFSAMRCGRRQKGGRPISYEYLLKLCHRRAKAAGIERIGTHAGRATTATGLLERGTAPRDVMHWLRHQSLTQTMKYDRGGGEAQRRVARKV